MQNKTGNLKVKHCVPCEGEIEPMTKKRYESFLKEIPEWKVIDEKLLAREFKFKDFKEALAFVNNVGGIAEAEQHHPDINVHNWNKVTITLSTHAIKGLSENDFILASKINDLV